jgi:hypothetical protein
MPPYVPLVYYTAAVRYDDHRGRRHNSATQHDCSQNLRLRTGRPQAFDLSLGHHA